MINVPLADAAGAVLISKKYFDGLSADLQDILKRNGRTAFRKLTELSREENRQAVEEFKKRGITIIDVAPNDLKVFVDAGAAARRELVGKMYSKDLLDRVEKELAAYRSKQRP
jgi:TRAP-type C4-dicarboxylate transport system substrate-binding protein